MMEEEIKQTLAEQEADENLRAALAMPQDHRERKACCTILQRLLKYLYEDRRLRGIAESIRQKIADLEQKLRTPAPKLKVALIMISALMMVAGVVVFGVSQKKFFLLFTLVGVGILALTIVRTQKRKTAWRAFLASCQEQLNIAKEDLAKAEADVAEYRERVLNPYLALIVPDRFPAVYSMNIEAVEVMLAMLVNLRGNTMKEAINLYEEAVFRTATRNMMVNMQNSLASTARSAARSAIANEAAAVSAAATAASAAATAASAASIAKSQQSMARSAERSAAANESAARAITNHLQ